MAATQKCRRFQSEIAVMLKARLRCVFSWMQSWPARATEGHSRIVDG